MAWSVTTPMKNRGHFVLINSMLHSFGRGGADAVGAMASPSLDAVPWVYCPWSKY
jgi:hypothetical protein